MKIGLMYGPFSTGNRPFNLDNLYYDPRGLTGSELSFFSLARELAYRGHDITLVCKSISKTTNWFGCNVLGLDQIHELQGPGTGDFNIDAMCSWNEPDVLRDTKPGVVRLCNQQLNDFGYCTTGFDDFVDIYTSPSPAHLDYITKFTPDSRKWTVLSNGCEAAQYPSIPRIPNRVIYASSPDRGLHLLLQAWPKIRLACPEAHLRIFYNFEPWFRGLVNTQSPLFDIREAKHRALYIREALSRLSNYGVEHCHSISRMQMAREMAEATVLAYPFAPLRWTEGYSVTLMEACAAGVLPVTSAADALGQIYGNCVPMVPAPVEKNLEEFTDLVILGLRDEAWREETIKKTKELSKSHEWSIVGERLEKILLTKIETGAVYL